MLKLREAIRVSMHWAMRRRSLAAAVSVLLATSLGFSQTPAALSGTVKDPSGLVVPDVLVILTNDQTSAEKQTTATKSGTYSFDGVPAGDYTIHVAARGFKDPTKKLKVTAGQPMSFDIALELEQSAESVEVSSSIDPFNVVPDVPTNSMFGFDKALEEIPRSISVADAELLTRYNVRTVNDIVTVSPGTFTGSYFGIPGSVFLRGDIGDNFFRGFRRVENRGNYQTPVAATTTSKSSKARRRPSMAVAALADS